MDTSTATTTKSELSAEWQAFFAEIFPPKPEPVSSELPAALQMVVDTAALPYIAIVLVNMIGNGNGAVGHLDINQTYNQPAIVLARNERDFMTDKITARTTYQLQRTLAHELGHWQDLVENGSTYESKGFKACEDYADHYRVEMLKALSLPLQPQDYQYQEAQ